MWDYLRKVIKEFPEEITGVCATPAGDYLFKVRDDGKKLNKEQAEVCRESSAERYPNSGVFSHHSCEGP